MGINSPITWGVNWPNNRGQLYRNAGLAVDADLGLFVLDADISVRMQSCSDLWETQMQICSDPFETRSYSDPRLKWDAELLRPTLEVERGVTQTCVRHGVTQIRIWCGTRSCSDPRETRNYLDSCLRWDTEFVYLWMRVRILVETGPSR